jgi:ribosome-binding protein aMBF1 (putative translation factor)
MWLGCEHICVKLKQYPVLGYLSTLLYHRCQMGRSTLKVQQKRLQALLRQVRVEGGLRQIDLAKRLGQPQSFISKYESGERRLDLPELREVCKALGISLGDFVRRFEDSHN